MKKCKCSESSVVRVVVRVESVVSELLEERK